MGKANEYQGKSDVSVYLFHLIFFQIESSFLDLIMLRNEFDFWKAHGINFARVPKYS